MPTSEHVAVQRREDVRQLQALTGVALAAGRAHLDDEPARLRGQRPHVAHERIAAARVAASSPSVARL